MEENGLTVDSSPQLAVAGGKVPGPIRVIGIFVALSVITVLEEGDLDVILAEDWRHLDDVVWNYEVYEGLSVFDFKMLDLWLSSAVD